MNIVERITQLQTIPLTKVNLTKKIYDRREITNSSYLEYEPLYSLYVANIGAGNRPLIIQSNNFNLSNGESELYLSEITKPLDWIPEMVGVFRKNFSYLGDDIEKKYSDLRNHDNPAQEIGAWLQHNHFKFYETTIPVSKKVLKELSEDDFEFIMDTYIDGGFSIDKQIRDWARMNLIKFTPDSKNIGLVKAKPHALIIKNEKVGVSHIADRIGENIDQISLKSLEGMSDAQGEISHSPLHNNFGSINLDEVLEISPNILQKCFNYVEMGKYNTYKASRQILNEGAVCLTFTSNPEELRKSEGGEVEPLDYVNSFLKILYALTQRPAPAFSRLGRIIFSNKLDVASHKKNNYSYELLNKVNAIGKSIIEHSTPQFTKIYWDSWDWLNEPIPEYNESIDDVIEQAGSSLNSIIREAWLGNKNAYKHIRGGALALSCIDNIRSIFFNEYRLKELHETAEEKLTLINEYNIQSFKKIIEFSSITEKPESFIKKFQSTKPDYAKAILLSYIMVGKDSPNKVLIDPSQIESAFNSIPSKVKTDILGGERYAYLGRIEDITKSTLQLNKIQRCFEALYQLKFSYQVLESGKFSYVIENDQAKAKQYFDHLSKHYPLPQNASSISHFSQNGQENAPNTDQTDQTAHLTEHYGKGGSKLDIKEIDVGEMKP